VAPPAGTLRVGRYFLALVAILAVLYAIVFWPGQRHTPKLGIDLAGGQEVVFTAHLPRGSKGNPSKSSMQEAKQIMTDRVNGSGVTQATVVIQGGNQLVVSIPGSSSKSIADLGKAAQLSLRGLVMPTVTQTCLEPTTGGIDRRVLVAQPVVLDQSLVVHQPFSGDQDQPGGFGGQPQGVRRAPDPGGQPVGFDGG